MGLEERARREAARQDAEQQAREAAAAPGRTPVKAGAHPDLRELVDMLNRYRVPTAPVHTRVVHTVRGKQRDAYQVFGAAWFISVWDGDVDSTPGQRAVVTTTGDIFTSWRWEFVYDEMRRWSRNIEPVPTRGGHPPRVFLVDEEGRLTANNVASQYWMDFVAPLAIDLVRRGSDVKALSGKSASGAAGTGFITVTVPIGTR